ncbi:hypothetical protein FKM82_004128 [Ascaphus truei]
MGFPHHDLSRFCIRWTFIISFILIILTLSLPGQASDAWRASLAGKGWMQTRNKRPHLEKEKSSGFSFHGLQYRCYADLNTSFSTGGCNIIE